MHRDLLASHDTLCGARPLRSPGAGTSRASAASTEARHCRTGALVSVAQIPQCRLLSLCVAS
jgi:hypothetical protein